MSTPTRLEPAEARELAEQALLASGAGHKAAAALAAAIIAAELDGIASHGLAYLPTYCEHLRCGKVIGSAEPRLERPKPAALVVDAGSGFAHPAITLGFESLIPVTREQGSASLAVINSYNCGVLGYHTERLALAGLVGLGFTNAPASIAPPGGHRAVVGTNPISLAVPDGRGGVAVLIDQSASVVAKSEVMAKARTGEALPEGWALDAAGHPTTDPQAALSGTMMPAGRYKGFGAGLITEVFAAVLAGPNLGIEASPFSGTKGGPPKTGQFFIAIDPAAFSAAELGARLKRLVAAIADQGARVPGERRRANRERIGREGIAVDAALLERIRRICG